MTVPNETLATRQIVDPTGDRGLQLLVITQGKSTTFALPESGERVLGRSSDCDIRIDDDSLSRRHARLIVGPALSIEDLGTLNGTRVRDARIEANRPVRIAVGEVVDVGTAMVVVQHAD